MADSAMSLQIWCQGAGLARRVVLWSSGRMVNSRIAPYAPTKRFCAPADKRGPRPTSSDVHPT